MRPTLLRVQIDTPNTPERRKLGDNAVSETILKEYVYLKAKPNNSMVIENFFIKIKKRVTINNIITRYILIV